MKLLAVPNWSFGRNNSLLYKFQDILSAPGVQVHYCQGDVDHNRTVTAFSGQLDVVEATLLGLCELALDVIDLNRHIGVHPRIGALDVCPFVQIDEQGESLLEALAFAERMAAKIAEAWEVPVFLYERSERGRHESDLPSLRRGGFGGLAGKTLRPDFGPLVAHPRLGVTILGLREFLIAMNVNLKTENVEIAKKISAQIRLLRIEGDERFLGVRAMGFALASRGQVQVSINSTLPDLTSCDPILEWVIDRALNEDVPVAGCELIGVIRTKDLPSATRLPVRSEQIVS